MMLLFGLRCFLGGETGEMMKGAKDYKYRTDQRSDLGSFSLYLLSPSMFDFHLHLQLLWFSLF